MTKIEGARMCSYRSILSGVVCHHFRGRAAIASALHPLTQRGSVGEPEQKKRRTVQECVAELKDLKELLDGGVLTHEEFKDLKEKLLRGD